MWLPLRYGIRTVCIGERRAAANKRAQYSERTEKCHRLSLDSAAFGTGNWEHAGSSAAVMNSRKRKVPRNERPREHGKN
jgi:hypothetical protein